MANNNYRSSPASPATDKNAPYAGLSSAGPNASVDFAPTASRHYISPKKVEYAKSPILIIASIVAVSNVIVMLVAFLTANWVVTHADLGAYGTKAQQVGLWQYCFNSSHKFSFRDARKKVDTEETIASDPLAEWLKTEGATPLSGCRWLWQFDFWYLKDYMHPPFFVTGQILFTVATILTVAVGCHVVKLWRYRYVGREIPATAGFSIVSAVSGFCTLVTLIVFAVSVYSGTWLIDWSIATVSWSYGVATAGLVLSFCTSILFGLLAHRLQAAAARSPVKLDGMNEKESSNVQLLRYNESDFAAAGDDQA